jgi:signal transduction histidine kinase
VAEPSRPPRFRAVALTLLALTLLAATGVVAVRSIHRSIDLDLQAGGSSCALEHTTYGCVTHIAGVAISPRLFTREVEYLPSAALRDAWFAQQDRLYDAVRASATVTVRATRGDLPLATRRRGHRAMLWEGAPALVSAFAMLAVGIWVGLRGRTRAAAWLASVCVSAFCAMTLTAANNTRGLALDAATSRAAWWINVVALAACAVSLVGLSAEMFRAEAARAASRWVGVAVAAAVAVVAGDLSSLTPGACFVFIVAALAVAAARMVHGGVRADTQVQRAQAKWIAWGIAIPFVVLLVSSVPLLLPGSTQQTAHDMLVTPSIVAFPIGVGFAVLRARLFDVELVIRRTVVGAALTSATLVAYHGLLLAFSVRREPGDPVSAMLLTAMSLSLILQPLQTRLEARLDLAFARRRYGYVRALGRLPERLAESSEAGDAARAMIEVATRVMESPAALVALDPTHGGARWEQGADPAAEVPWAALAHAPPTSLTDAERDDEVQRWMRRARFDAVFPLRTSSRFIGVFACATPRGSRVFASDALDGLRASASALAVALDRALALDTIRAINAGLEETVRERTAERDAVRLRLFQREKMSSIALLAAGVAHELNTPLGVAHSTAQQLVEELDEARHGARAVRLARLCVEAARRGAETVNALREFSRPGERDAQHFYLGECVSATLRVLGPALRAAGVEAVVDAPDLPALRGHPALVNQVLMNLLNNALAAMPGGGSVSLTLRGDARAQRVSVEDTGPGIPPDVRDKIFDPFFTTRGHEGTGLGLALCFAIMEIHGGRIWEDGAPGRGARFELEFPVVGPQPAEGPDETSSQTRSSA